jgi:transcriptional regulator with XRE-family HTH domain
MKELATVLGVSLATAYRYRKNPSEMSLAAFDRLAAHLRVPVSMNLVYRETDVLAAEEARLGMEREIAAARSWRFVATPHFTVNCEIEAFTRELIEIQYGERMSADDKEAYVRARAERRRLYLEGAYRSEEVIYGPAYVDFFYGRGMFESISKSVRLAQLREVIATSRLAHVCRRVYASATPELPVILNYGVGKSVIRVEDLTICFTDEDCNEAVLALRDYAKKALHTDQPSVQAFLENPLSPM